jgi:DNA repair protein RecN (Recombination protein N)
MLRRLSIHDMVLIETAEIAFEPGLNVLTGETGAGKSILLDSLGFVLGWRVRPGLVRAGAKRGEVTAEFELAPGHPVRDVLAEAGLPVEDLLLLRRVSGADGKRRAWVNDRPVTAETLRALGEALVELHGQHDDKGLLDAKRHRDLLDAFAGAGAERDAVRDAWGRRAAVARAVWEAEAALETAARDADFVAHAVAEIEELSPLPGEEPELDARRRQLRLAEEIRGDVERTAQAIGREGGEGALLQAMRWLEAVAAKADGIADPILEGLERVLSELADVARGVEDLQAGLSGDPEELETVEERLFAIRSLARKHQVLPDELAGLAEELRARLDAIQGGTERIGALKRELDEVDEQYNAAAAALGVRRRQAAGELDERMGQELPPLKLDRARFVTGVNAGDPGPDGSDQVRFTAATNPGTPPGPIDRIASGGELSRFLLALKVCLAERSSDLTLIFDEIDRGVGGATADAVGRRLQSLGERFQVLVVTHAPQVAARGAHHWRVGKLVRDGATRTEVVPLATSERTEEIARMLAGDVITAEARGAARALLEA